MIREDKLKDYKELKTLLVKSGAYYYFLENLAKKKFENCTQDMLHNYINYTDPMEYINFAFDWSKSDQGFDFWSDIDDKWLKIVHDTK